MTTAETIVAVDVGNSAIKVAIASSTQATLSERKPGHPECRGLLHHSFPLDQLNWSEQLCGWVAQNAGDKALSWWVSTVNRAASGPLHDAVALRFSAQAVTNRWRILDHEQIPLKTEVDCPERLGIDRLVSAYAASNRYTAPLVVVDAGSAVTVDWIRRESDGTPVFAGGAILPGIRLQHSALAAGTEGLRSPADNCPADNSAQSAGKAETGELGTIDAIKPGTNTQQAIRLGILAAVVGGVDRLANEYFSLAQSLPKSPLLVVTGGDGPRISASLKAKHVLVPNLVCLGLLDLANRERQNATSGLK